MYTYVCVYMYTYIYIYIYIYTCVCTPKLPTNITPTNIGNDTDNNINSHTVYLPTNIVGFRGLDSSIILT